MKIIEGLEQGSEEWLAYRRMHIMATDASSIIGSNPWSTSLDVYNEKFQLVAPKETNERMRRGQLLEPDARELFCEMMCIEMGPCVVESDHQYWAAASLDGLSKCKKYILEIKCPNNDTHELAIEGHVKPFYMAQMQWQLYVTRCDKCFYWSYNPDNEKKFALIEIVPNLEYIMDLTTKARCFYENHMLTMIPPEEWKFKSR